MYFLAVLNGPFMTMNEAATYGPILGLLIYYIKWFIGKERELLDPVPVMEHCLEGFMLLAGVHLLVSVLAAPHHLVEFFDQNGNPVNHAGHVCKIDPLHKVEIMLGGVCAIIVSLKSLRSSHPIESEGHANQHSPKRK